MAHLKILMAPHAHYASLNGKVAAGLKAQGVAEGERVLNAAVLRYAEIAEYPGFCTTCSDPVKIEHFGNFASEGSNAFVHALRLANQ